MAKVAIQVEDVMKFGMKIIIEQPGYMTDDELEAHLKTAKKKINGGNARDFEAFLEKMGFHIYETTSSPHPPFSPDSTKMEIVDVRDVKEE